MAQPKITFAFPVESVSRKMTLRKNTASTTLNVGNGQHVNKEIARYMGAGVRSTPVNDVGVVKKNYFFVRFNARTSAISADEQYQRLLFGNASKLAARWKQDLSSIVDQLNAFKNHLPRKGVTSYGKSYYKFRFHVAMAVLEDGGTVDSAWPTA